MRAAEKECPVINEQDAAKKPWFLIDPNNAVTQVGNRVVFHAQATGQPMPSIKWYGATQCCKAQIPLGSSRHVSKRHTT